MCAFALQLDMQQRGASILERDAKPSKVRFVANDMIAETFLPEFHAAFDLSPCIVS